MIRSIIVAGLCLCGLCALPSRVRAQDAERDSVYTYVSGSDTLHYTYTPLAPEPPRRKPFLQRVVDYFGGSTVDRTFEKKRSEEHTSELQSRFDSVCRLLLEKKKK